MHFNTILVEIENGVATLTLNRPAAYNAISQEMTAELSVALAALRDDPNVRTIILKGAGKAFSAGGDVKEMLSSTECSSQYLELIKKFNEMAELLLTMPKPVIAAVQGIAVGAGCSFALAADICIAGKSARFGMAFSGVGLSPDAGATFTLPRAVGLAKAKELVFRHNIIDAATALEIGLVNTVVEDSELNEVAEKLAYELAEGPTLAYALSKKMINNSFSVTLKEALECEAVNQALLASSHDFLEGRTAFAEKRPPNFNGS